MSWKMGEAAGTMIQGLTHGSQQRLPRMRSGALAPPSLSSQDPTSCFKSRPLLFNHFENRTLDFQDHPQLEVLGDLCSQL